MVHRCIASVKIAQIIISTLECNVGTARNKNAGQQELSCEVVSLFYRIHRILITMLNVTNEVGKLANKSRWKKIVSTLEKSLSAL